MKKISYIVVTLAVMSLGGVLWLNVKAPLRLEGEAQAQLAPRSLVFDQGIGFYYYTNGQLHWLGYPTGERNNIREESIEITKNDFKLYSYGIDYSKSPMGLPPHLLNFCVVLYSPQYNLSNPDFLSRTVNERQGPYAVHFIPIPGSSYPTYEITCDLWPDLAKKVPTQVVWGFKVRDGVEGTVRPLIYWFMFKDPKAPPEDNVMSFGG